MEAPTMGQSSSPSALHLHGIKTPTFDDDGIAPQCSDDDDLEDFAKIHIADTTGKDVEQDAMNFRFFGKSSGVVLVQTAIDLKNEFSGLPLSRLSRKPMFTSKRPEFWSTRPVSDHWLENLPGLVLTLCYSGSLWMLKLNIRIMNSQMMIS